MCPQRIIHFQDDFAFFREWDLIRDLYPKLILATHDDKESVIALLKTIDDKINRGFTSKNLILYTLPTRPHKALKNFFHGTSFLVSPELGLTPLVTIAWSLQWLAVM